MSARKINSEDVLIVCDFDGTFLDSVPLMYKSALAVLRYDGVLEDRLPTIHEWLTGLRPPWMSWYKRWGLSNRMTEAQVFDVFSDFMLRHYQEQKLFHGVVEFNTWLTSVGVENCIVTAQHSDHILSLNEGSGLGEIFPRRKVFGRDIHHSKITKIAMARERFPRRICFHLGDSLSDTEEAKVAGVIPLAMCHEGTVSEFLVHPHRDRGAEWCFRNFPELRAWTERRLGLI